MDRIDMHVEVPRVPLDLLAPKDPTPTIESSSQVRSRVERCRQTALGRVGCPNSQLSGHPLETACIKVTCIKVTEGIKLNPSVTFYEIPFTTLPVTRSSTRPAGLTPVDSFRPT